MSEKTFALQVEQDGIAIITMDVPGETMNVLRESFVDEISELLNQIEGDEQIRGVVFTSGKSNSFIAGADISMLDQFNKPDDGYRIATLGQKLFARLQKLRVPIVAAIDGPCLGGGLELALACDYRICSESESTKLGLPEVQLGLLPGSGGTQRLPRLIGLAKALGLMLTGRQLRAKQAAKMGLVDEAVPSTILMDVAHLYAQKSKRTKISPKRNDAEKWLEVTALGRSIIFDRAKKNVVEKTKGNYPAPLKIIECVQTGYEKGVRTGFEREATLFGELVMTPESKALRSIFFATTEMKKETGANKVKPKDVKNVLVLGGGLMGGGIASVTALKAKLPIRIKDINSVGLKHALAYSYKQVQSSLKKRRLNKAQADKSMGLLSATTEYSGVKATDIVVEAVFEDINLKHQMVKDVEKHCNENTIFASNTSSLPISKIAQVAKRPQNVVGLHYFSPVEKMPLVEVIAHSKTSAETIATTVAFARKQGKTPIVVTDGAGFYVNRILALYMNEAANLLMEGEPIDIIDKALVDFGFPVGPITLLDEVGIDVGAKISPILYQELGERFEIPGLFVKLLTDERKGKKNGRGFYRFDQQRKGEKSVDESVYNVIGVELNPRLPLQTIAERCVIQMLNEAVRCLEEGIIASPRDGDIGAVFGIGFPPFLGGPFRYIDTLGASQLVSLLQGYEKRFGTRFKPANRLIKMAEQGETFN